MFKDLIQKNRSYRRFHEDHKIERDTLKELVDLARLCPSASNKQPLKYILSSDPEKNKLIFPHLEWAGYLKDWGGPQTGERPSAYIIVLCDTKLSASYKYDCGIAAQSILLGATEKGLGGCMIALVHKKELRQALGIPDQYQILLVIALGKPSEEVKIEKINADGNIEYWRDEKSIHHVPKRTLDEIIIG